MHVHIFVINSLLSAAYYCRTSNNLLHQIVTFFYIVKMDRGDSLLSSSAKIKLIVSVVAEKNESKDGNIMKINNVFSMKIEGEKYKFRA